MEGFPLLLSTALSALADCAFALAVGTALAGRWLDGLYTLPTSQPALPSRLRSCFIASVLTLFAAQLARPWFLAASMSGDSGFRENLALIPSILSSTHQGSVWRLTTAATLILAATGLPVLWRRTTARRLIELLCILAIAWAKAASSHASGDGDFTRLETLQWLHILATAVWAGGVIVSGLVLVPAFHTGSDQAVCTYGHRLSKAATFAVLTVLITGAYTTDRELPGRITTLLASLWGDILFTKIILACAALTLGASSRFFCLTGEISSRKAALFRRLLVAEAWVMLAVLCLSGWLGNTAPPMA